MLILLLLTLDLAVVTAGLLGYKQLRDQASAFNTLMAQDKLNRLEWIERINREARLMPVSVIPTAAETKVNLPPPPPPAPADAREERKELSRDIHNLVSPYLQHMLQMVQLINDHSHDTPTPAASEAPIDMKSLLELTHAQQLSMITMVAQVVKDISKHAAETVTAPLMSTLNRPQLPQGPIMMPEPWYTRSDREEIDGEDPMDRYMQGNPYYKAPGPSAGYVAPDAVDSPMGIEGVKWPPFQEGMIPVQREGQGP